jgi:hypothetical protein
MDKSKLQIGTELVAINPCLMRSTGEEALVVGKEYKIIDLTKDEDDEDEVVIIDEQNEEHWFLVDELCGFFTYKGIKASN